MRNSLKKHILIIDDSKDIHSLLTLVFESKGHTVVCCANGREALNSLGANSIIPDVILLDVVMPVMSGDDFLRHRAADSRLKDIPVVVMSGLDENPLTTPDLVFSSILKKPFSLHAAIAAVERDYGPAAASFSAPNSTRSAGPIGALTSIIEVAGG